MRKSLIFICLFLLTIGTIFATLRNASFSKENLNKFYQLTKNDPLFYDPSTDVDFLETTVTNLARMDDVILQNNAMFEKSDSHVYPKDWRLWPDKFLATLPLIHKATTNFLADPNPRNATLLLNLYEKSVKEYKEAISLHIIAMENTLKAKPQNEKKKIIFLGSATTPQIVLNDFLLIQKNAQALENEVEERKKCFNHGACKTPNVVTEEKKENAVVIAFKPLPDDILGINRNSEKVFGPYWATTGCFGFTSDGKEYSYPFYLIQMTEKNTEANLIKPMMTNTKYYRDFRRIPDKKLAQMAMENGIAIRPHSGVNDYLCTDLRYIPELIMRYGEAKDKFATLPYLIQHTLSFSDFAAYFPVVSKKAFDPLYLLINRSAYSLYFGTFSNAIWRIQETPIFLIKQDFRSVVLRAGYATYEDLVAEGLDIEAIKKLNTLPHLGELYFATQSGLPQ